MQNNSSWYRDFRVIKRNSEDKPITYTAVSKNTNLPVVIKKLDYALAEIRQKRRRRLQALKAFKDSRIACQFISMERSSGTLYQIREFINAKSLAELHTLLPEDIKAIAVALLEVLVELQRPSHPIIHGNLKPENIFLKQSRTGSAIVLTDFKPVLFTPETDLEILGFTPPEQILGESTKASDNYAIGAVLLSLLSGTPTCQMYDLTSKEYPHLYQVKKILSSQAQEINPHFIVWLKRMLEPDCRDRFPDARTALQALQPLKILSRTQASLSHSALYLEAKTYGEVLREYIHVSNLIPQTLLKGRWCVSSPNDSCEWICITPTELTGNEATVEVSIDTRQLQAGETYNRDLTFESNSSCPVITVPLSIKTAKLKKAAYVTPIWFLTGLLISSAFLPIAIGIFFTQVNR